MSLKADDRNTVIETVLETASPSDTTEGAASSADPLDGSLGLPAPFERVAEALEKVKRHCPDLPVLAIHWMHLNHPMHPYLAEWMKDVAGTGDNTERPARREGSGVWRTLVALPWQFGISLLYAGYLVIRLLRLRWCLRREIGSLKRQRFDVVAKTWRFGLDPISTGRDFYYGDLQQRLSERGLNLLLLGGDAKGQRDWCTFSRAQVVPTFPWLLPEWCLVPLHAPFQLVGQQVLALVRLLRLAKRSKDALVKRVARQASRECLSRYNIPFGFYYWIGKVAVQTWHPKAVITLYEGRGWEPCLRRGVKAADATCLTVGYQHTILLRHQAAMLRPMNGAPPYAKPDIVLCLGPRTQAMLAPGHAHAALIPFGTFRHVPEISHLRSPRPHQRTVLVVPEGYIEEERLLFNCAMRAAQLLPHHRFIFRCHPVLPFEQVRSQLEQQPESLPNIEVSTRQMIAEDFARSSVVFYRGSSSVLYALMDGLKPVYLYDESTPDVDPLFALTGWRERVDSVQVLCRALQRYANSADAEAAAAWRDAAAHVAEYTIPVTETAVDQWLSAMGMTPARILP